MSTWSELIDAGYSRMFGVAIEGIPYAFLETQLLTTLDEPIAVPSGYTSAPASLRVRESDRISRELDRVTGLGRGRSLDLVFALDALAVVGAELFQTPSVRAQLTADADGTQTTFAVNSTTGFPASGSFYVGREFCTYSGTTGTSFTGVTRAVAGLNYLHPSSTASGYRFCTDRPQYWRGRFVTVYEHLVGPDGRALAGTACSVGSYCREFWKGYVDAQPQIDGRQMLLRCLPIERLLAQDLGGTAKGKVVFHPLEDATAPMDAFGRYPIVVTPSDTVYVENLDTNDNATLSLATSAPTIVNLDSVALSVEGGVRNSAVFSPRLVAASASVWTEGETPRMRFRLCSEDPATNAREVMTLRANVWFLSQFERPTTYTERIDVLSSGGGFSGDRQVTGDDFKFEVKPNEALNPWVVVKPDLEADGEPTTWPSSGYIMLENDEGLELARFANVIAAPSWAQGQLVAFQLTERALQGTTRINPFLASTLATAVPGERGTLEEVIETLATSSGTGGRGVYDTLGYGLGLGIPGSWFDLDGWPLSSQYVDGASDDKASVEKVAGGWLALLGRCLTQRRGADGYVRIEAVPTTLDVPGLALTVTPASVMVGSTQAERLFESPNVVRIEDTLRQKRTVSVIRDVPRQQAEGARTVTFIAPGINTASALILGGKVLALSDGQLVVTMGVRPGLELQVGDPCRLNLDHPAIWSWADGEVAQSVPARVIGETMSLGTGERTLTFLVPGQQQVARQLCPAARVDGYLSTVLLEVDDITGFAAGMEVRIYRRGNAGLSATRTVAAVDATYQTIELTTPVVSATYPADGDTWLTYADFGAGTAAQDEHLYVSRGSFEA
jgi:hypothetical protein